MILPWVLPINVDAIDAQFVHHRLDMFCPLCSRGCAAGCFLEPRITPSSNGYLNFGTRGAFGPESVYIREERKLEWRLIGIEDVGSHEGKHHVCYALERFTVSWNNIVLTFQVSSHVLNNGRNHNLPSQVHDSSQARAGGH